VALVGPTGSGKTTTADLLMGLLHPAAGSILVDGKPLTDEKLQSWRANIAHVPQMLFVADATVAENIALGAEIDPERVREAGTMASLDDFVSSSPKGYQTRVGERGAQISGGQRQRLAIARAIYKDAPLLVFDEATSALDEVTEQAVLAALDQLQAKGTTIIIIAHRESTTERCDQVLRLENGRLVEDSSGAG
jgi:ABC-type multidrug transport system fused ATPase/permease subunit